MYWTTGEVILFQAWARTMFPEVTVLSVVVEPDGRVTDIETNCRDESVPDDYVSVILNTYEAIRRGDCCICHMKPASRSLTLTTLGLYAGVCQQCYMGDGIEYEGTHD